MSALICWILFSAVMPTPFLVLDMNAKKPPVPATEFAAAQFISRRFPIYTADLSAVIDALENAAKMIDQRPLCDGIDTLMANHTLVIVKTDCTNGRTTSVRLVTRSLHPKFLYDFQVVRTENNARKAQAKLLHFAAYLSR